MANINERSQKIFLVGNEKCSRSFYNYIKQIYTLATPQKHLIVSEPEEADIILFVDFEASNYFKSLREHHLVKKMLEKCYVYTETDIVIPFLPGVYTSAETSFINLKRLKNYCYLSRHSYSKNSYIAPRGEEKEYLFTFLGGSTSLIRKRLYNINFKQPKILVEDTTHYQHWNYTQANRDQMQQRYVEICAKSRFVLCPRGAGCGSIRLFEMMEMGVAPVIIADNYLLPEGPRWEDFVVFVQEKDIRELPIILEKRAPDAERMGKLARKSWEEWFAPDKQFNYIIEACHIIRENRIVSEKVYRVCWKLLIVKVFVWSYIRACLKEIILRAIKLLNIKLPYSIKGV
ncbi:exostosin domain-containing protein [Pontibacter sp. MBLB2868]|uniref:exostosin domain-containing protein n=1 Tax=Pontibacter sp. MBLB2868 TaxID=3451555 RepID=UPI003F74B106